MLTENTKPKIQPRRVLYVCPYAHYPGHYSYFAKSETSLLFNAGIEVHLLTFEGLLDREKPKVIVHHCVLSRDKTPRFLAYLLDWGRGRLITKWFLMFVEVFLTLLKAMWLRRKFNYQIIHLRDGEPFIFIPHLLSLFSRKLNWLVWLVSNPNRQFVRFENKIGIGRNLGFAILNKLINTKLWRPIYRRSLSRNRFIFLTENEKIKEAYENYQGGVFWRKVACFPLPSEKLIGDIMKKEEARQHLGLPENSPIILSFGTIHSGKDIKVVLEAIKHFPKVVLVQAGKIPPWQISNLKNLMKAQSGKVMIMNYYIPESEKKYYFSAADVIILSYVKDFQQSASLLWEACRFRTPVIASDCGELGNLMKVFRVGLLFEPQKVDSLRETITHFLNLTSEQKREIEENCKRFNSTYSSEKWVQKILEIYQNLLNSN
jgi:glycosyltransferase involved in cell wall biosynthesis